MTVRLQSEFSFSKKHKIGSALVLLLALSGCSVYTTVYGQLNNFIDESKNLPGSPDPNSRFVVLNSGIAAMAEQQFGLPKNTQSYPLAGMTVFPYYQASAPLKEFLNNAMVFGMPVTKFPTTPNLPQVSLPPTDLVRRSIPIPSAPFERGKSAKLSINDKKMKDEVPWMVAHEGGQAIQVPGDNEALALVAPGSMFSACASRTMVLRCGTMWIFTGARPAAVLTKDAAVLVKPFSIAAVETTWYNRLRVASLYGQPVEMQVAYEGKADKCIVENRKEISISEVLVEGSAGNNLISSKPLADGNKSVDSGKSAAGAENTFAQAPELSTVPLAVPGLKAFSASINPRKCNLLGELAAVEPPFSNPRMSSDFARMFSSFGITVAMRREEMKRQEKA